MLTRLRPAVAGLLGAIGATLMIAGPAAAQDDAMVALGEQIWRDKASCRECHGNLADGVPENHQAPKGANLRETTRDTAALAEAIQCGLPGIPMPYFDRRAYTDDRCYGSTAADLGDQMPPPGTPALTQREINALSAFITAKFVGKGPVTFEECVAFFGESATSCPGYPKAADVAAPAQN